MEIENQSTRQPFLGGLRKKSNGVCLYHAQTQTDYTVGPDDRPRLLMNSKRPITVLPSFPCNSTKESKPTPLKIVHDTVLS